MIFNQNVVGGILGVSGNIIGEILKIPLGVKGFK